MLGGGILDRRTNRYASNGPAVVGSAIGFWNGQRMSNLRICVDARAAVPETGGVYQTILGVLMGLSELAGEEEYYALLSPGREQWVSSLLGGNLKPLMGRSRWKHWIIPLISPGARRLVHRFRQIGPPHIPESDGTAERAGAQLIHFTTQGAFRTVLPSIYNPQDLQHLHLPESFTAKDRRWRDLAYPFFCAQAKAVVALTRWGKQDLVKMLDLDPDKIYVIGGASLVSHLGSPGYEALRNVQRRYSLPEAFALFPATAWRHKNHLRLVDALAILKRKGVRIDVVCTGAVSEFQGVIVERMRSLGVADQIRFLGFVPEQELASLYHLARLLIFPSLFEGFGLPLVEAFEAGLPVACSNSSALPEVAGNCALLFNPSDPEEMSEAMLRLWKDDDLRSDLVRRGRSRVAGQTWERVARNYRALYRFVGGGDLSDEDRRLLSESR